MELALEMSDKMVVFWYVLLVIGGSVFINGLLRTKKENKMFKTGDVVQLKSGGPRMTVAEDQEDADSELDVLWFDIDSQLQSASIDPKLLILNTDYDNRK